MPVGLPEHSVKARRRMRAGLLPQVAEARDRLRQQRGVADTGGGAAAPRQTSGLRERVEKQLAGQRVQRRHSSSGGAEAPVQDRGDAPWKVAAVRRDANQTGRRRRRPALRGGPGWTEEQFRRS